MCSSAFEWIEFSAVSRFSTREKLENTHGMSSIPAVVDSNDYYAGPSFTLLSIFPDHQAPNCLVHLVVRTLHTALVKYSHIGNGDIAVWLLGGMKRRRRHPNGWSSHIRRTNLLVRLMIDWMIDWSIDWLIDWLIDIRTGDSSQTTQFWLMFEIDLFLNLIMYHRFDWLTHWLIDYI